MNRITAIVAAAAIGLTAAAETVNPDEIQVIELNKEYELTFLGSFSGKFTPEESGQIIEYGTIPVYTLGAGNELQELTEAEGYTYAGFINGVQANQFHATAGVTYIFYETFIMNGGKFSIAMNPALALESSYPQINSVYDPAAYSAVELTFNQALNVGKATVKYGSEEAEVETMTYGATVSVLINDLLKQWYDAGKIEGGKELEITLSSLTNITGQTMDSVTYKFVTANKPVTLIDAQIPEEILSWYGSDTTNSKAVFTFSGNIEATPTVQLCYNPIELGYEYIEELTPEVDGNVLTVDFAGKLRVAQLMSANGTSSSTIYIRIVNMRDANGQIIWSDGQGTVGTFLYATGFREIPRLDIVSEFTPLAGAKLQGMDNVKIYFNCADHLQYDGVTFTSGNESVTVPMKEVTVDSISESEVELTVKIPQGWNDKKDVRITLSGLTTDDGYDHSREISAKFNGFVISYCNFNAGMAYKELEKGSILKIDTNVESGGTVCFTITDNEGEIIVPSTQMTAGNNGSFTYEFDKTIVLSQGLTYNIEFTTNDGGKENITINGATAPYVFSDVTFESIDPADGATIEPGQVITLTFSGLVNVYAAPGSTPFTAQPVVDDEESNYGAYSYKWELTLGDKLAQKVTMAFYASDIDLATVEGNEGSDDNSHFVFEYVTGVSGIQTVSTIKGQATIYDLNGRKVTTPTHGNIYIVNGRAVKF